MDGRLYGSVPRFLAGRSKTSTALVDQTRNGEDLDHRPRLQRFRSAPSSQTSDWSMPAYLGSIRCQISLFGAGLSGAIALKASATPVSSPEQHLSKLHTGHCAARY
jgi:hypothetical protein